MKTDVYYMKSNDVMANKQYRLWENRSTEHVIKQVLEFVLKQKSITGTQLLCLLISKRLLIIPLG